MVASAAEQEWQYIDLSEKKGRKMLKTVASHLNIFILPTYNNFTKKRCLTDTRKIH